ncbi:MAG: AbrB/MazE/SpoVT family DNA-binding domain-containing protein [Verrucomicrobiota bacterium]|nr:AbrB/MazE/SpoVT family DNA-binding domain-containing protein [Verrucomicrobiota bacterium]
MKTKISSKGQITIPLSVRNTLGFRKGTQLQIERGNQGQIILSKTRDKSFYLKFRGLKKDVSPWKNGQEALEFWRGKPALGDVNPV